MVSIETADGIIITIPLLDAICIEMDEEKKIISGRAFDIFAVRE